MKKIILSFITLAALATSVFADESALQKALCKNLENISSLTSAKETMTYVKKDKLTDYDISYRTGYLDSLNGAIEKNAGPNFSPSSINHIIQQKGINTQSNFSSIYSNYENFLKQVYNKDKKHFNENLVRILFLLTFKELVNYPDYISPEVLRSSDSIQKKNLAFKIGVLDIGTNNDALNPFKFTIKNAINSDLKNGGKFYVVDTSNKVGKNSEDFTNAIIVGNFKEAHNILDRTTKYESFLNLFDCK